MESRKRNWNRIATVAGILCFALLCILGIREFQLARTQQQMLQELDERKGTYDEQTIMLVGTSKGRASELARELNASLRITTDGTFATLTLPAGVTIRDICEDRENRALIPELTPDYMASTDEVDDEEDDASVLHRGGHHDGHRPEKPWYPVQDQEYELQSYLDYLNLSTVWEENQGRGVRVAVIDTGIDTDHPEFEGKISQDSYNATLDQVVADHGMSIIEDEQGHGTAVAGVIAAAMDGNGTVGVAPEAELLIIKVDCDQNGNFYRTSDLVFGLYYAIERNASVVNMSFGSILNAFSDATRLAYDSDILCIAAAGNAATTAATYPAADPYVLGVGALAEDGWELADYSNYGDNVNLVAPGTTYTTAMGGGYGTMTGTSFSAPCVAGALALYAADHQYYSIDEATELVYASCADLGGLGEDWLYGYGALDVSALILEEQGTVTFDMQTDTIQDITQVFIRDHTLQNIPEPEQLYVVFDGWYYDPQCTEPYNWYEDVFSTDLTLYAKWANEEDALPYTYVTLDDGTVEIRSYTGQRRYITIPDQIDGKTVSSIGVQAFAENDRLRQVNLPRNLRKIETEAFWGCISLTEIRIPASVETIGASAFADNTRLFAVEFEGSSALRQIGGFAFAGCVNLQRFEIPQNLVVMDGAALYGTTDLRQITVRSGNTAFAARDGVLFDRSGTTLVAYPAGKAGDYHLPDIVTTVGSYAFGYTDATVIDLNRAEKLSSFSFAYSNLKSIVIPDSVTVLEKGAFGKSVSLASVSIGSGVTVIGGNAFADCSALETVEIPTNVTGIDDSAFSGCFNLSEVTFAEGSNLTWIGGLAFAGISELTQIQIPATVTSIGSSAFYYDAKLSQVTFEQGSVLQSVGASAFEECISLTGLELPAGLWQLGDYAFRGSGLTEIRIPAQVQHLGAGVFASCHDLTGISVAEDNPHYVSENGVVYTADRTTLTAYPAGKPDSGFTIPDPVRTVADAAFYGSWNLTNVSVSPSVRRIGEYAFYDCRKMNAYNLAEGLTTIADYAFAENTALLSLSLPDSVEQLGRYGFQGDRALRTITISDNTSLTRLSYGAFVYSGLTSFRIPAKVSTIAQGVFEGCENLRTVEFAENSRIDSIAAYTFDGCENLERITFGSGSALTTIAAHGFEGMRNLRELDFGDAKLTQIGNYAFRFCESLTTFTIPDTLVEIGRFAFYECAGLEELTLPAGLEHIGSYAFYGAEKLDLYLESDFLPLYLDENWDNGINGYYVGVSAVSTRDQWKYATLNSGNISIVEYLGDQTSVDLSTLELGGDITAIGGHAFSGSSVEQVLLPDTLTSIQVSAFAGSGIKHIEIPAGVTFIGRSAFAQTPLETITFAGASQLRVIEQEAFAGTQNLESINLPASLTRLGSRTFYESGIHTVSFAAGIALEEIPVQCFAGSGLTEVVIPDSVVNIGDNAFRDCIELKTMTLGGGEDLYIGSNAFYNTGLTTAHIPENVGYIGDFAFVGLRNLTEFTVSEENPYYAAVDGLLMSRDGRKLIAVPARRSGDLTVPAGVEVIGFGAFENSALEAVEFASDANILTFGYRAFFGAENLSQMTVPASVVSIDYYAFAGCTALEQVDFAPDSRLTGIYEGAFYGCESLADITLPDSVVEISDYAFYGCSSLTQIPVGPESLLMGIYDYAFSGTGITELTIPDSVIDIGAYAFQGIDITEVTVPEANKEQLVIGIGAFADCNQITEITLPFLGASFENPDINHFGYIFGAGTAKANASYVPRSLKKVTITEGITCLGEAFYQVDCLEEIQVPHSVVDVDTRAFTDTVAAFELTNAVYFSGSLDTDMDNGIYGKLTLAGIDPRLYSFRFYGATGLEEVEIMGDVGSLQECMFYGCVNLKKVIIGEGITEIGANAFESCYSLATVVLPESLEIIHEHAFYDCALLEVTLGSKLHTIGESAFMNNEKLYLVRNNSDLTLDLATWDAHGRITEYAKLIIDKNGNKTYQNPNSGFTYVDTPDGFRFMLENGAYTLVSYTGTESTVTLPLTINGAEYGIYKVDGIRHLIIPEGMTYVSDYAFDGSAKLESVVIPGSVDGVGSYAFTNCPKLERVTIQPGVRRIYSAFESCSALRTIHLPDSIEYIGDSAFANCTSLVELVLPKNLQIIEQKVCYNCVSLAHVTIPDSVTEIAEEAFRGCTGLNDVSIPAGVTQIGEAAFADCTSLADFRIHPDNSSYLVENGIVYNADRTQMAFAFPGISGAVTIPDTITVIPEAAFLNCGGITSVEIPDSVTEVQDSAFEGCTALQQVRLPEGLEKLSQRIFANCSALTEIALPQSLITIRERAFEGCTALKRIEIPQSVTEIYYDLFHDCTSLEEAVLPDTLTVLGAGMFSGCTNLKRVVLPGGLKAIDSSVFQDCESLTEIEIPDSVTSIEYMAFYGCKSLQSIKIPDGVTYLGGSSFQNCDSLQEVTIPDSVTTLYESTFRMCDSLERVIIGNGVQAISDCAFAECEQLWEITIGTSVTEIDDHAFHLSNALRMIHNNSTLPLEIGSAEYGRIAENAWVIVGPDGTRTCKPGHEDYQGPEYLEDENGFIFVEEEGAYYLVGYSGTLDTVVLPASYQGMSYTIRKLQGPTDVTIPEGVLRIEDGAFSGTDLVRVHIGAGIEIGSAFSSCRNLTEVILDEGVTTIGQSAFYGCTALERITLPDSLMLLDSYAFNRCESLRAVEFGSGMPSIGTYVFHGTPIYNNPANWTNGMLIVGGHLIKVDETAKFADWSGDGVIADEALNEAYQMKQVVIGPYYSGVMGQTTNVEAVIVANTTQQPIRDYVGNFPTTLKSVVLKKGVEVQEDTFLYITDVTIYVEDSWEDSGAAWDVSFPEWTNGNTVYYGGEWITACFYDVDGKLMQREFVRTSQVIHKPYYEIPSDEYLDYILVGWDITGDGKADHIPATSSVDIHAYPVIESSQRSYTVTFCDTDGQTPLYVMELPYGGTVELPADPVKTGYTFQKWHGHTEGMTVTEDITLYASWVHKDGGHSYDAGSPVEATCTEPGGMRYTCAICGESYLEATSAAQGHSYQTTTVVGCEEMGYDLHECIRCGDSRRDNYTSAQGHSYGDWAVTKAPSCSSSGSHYRICIHCGDTQTEDAPMLPHNSVSTVIAEASCTAEGEIQHICSDCGHKITESIPVADHSYQRTEVSMHILEQLIYTLQEMLWGYDGETGYYFVCKDCDRIQTSEEQDSTQSAVAGTDCSHTDGEWTIAVLPENGMPGVQWRICGLCGKAVEAEVFTDTSCAHSWSEWTVVKAATEIEPGLRRRTCQLCGITHTEAFQEKITCNGDVNADDQINALDVLVLRQYLAGWDVTINPASADVNGDDTVNGLDVILLRQYVAGWDVELGTQ